MAGSTTNYGLTKPATGEAYDVTVPNNNMDLLDTNLKRVDTKIQARMDVTNINAQNIPTAAWTTALYQEVLFETPAGICTVGTGQIVPTKSGVYLVVFNAGIGAMNNTTWAQGARIVVNNVVQATVITPPSGAGGSLCVSSIVNVLSGQVIKGDVFQNSGANKQFSACSLAIHRIDNAA